MAQYGESSIDIWAAHSAVLTLTQIPIPSSASQLWAKVQDGAGSAAGMAQGALTVHAGVIAWCRFTYTALRQIALAIVKSVLANNQITTSQAWQVAWNTLYDLQADYTNIIEDREQRTCAGLKLMFGLDNPWADVLYYSCLSQASLVDNMFALALNVFVDIPMVTCICKDTSNLPVQLFAMEVSNFWLYLALFQANTSVSRRAPRIYLQPSCQPCT